MAQRSNELIICTMQLFSTFRVYGLSTWISKHATQKEIIGIVNSITAFIEHYKERFYGGKAPRVVARVIGTCTPLVSTVPNL